MIKLSSRIPLKHRRYTRAMTLCIAATFQWEPYRRAFLLCSDGRLDEGAWGHFDTGIKVHGLGHNSFGLMAGHWNTVRALCAAIENDHRKLFVYKDAEELLARLQSFAERFSLSALCTGRVEVLVTAFVEHNPVMFRGDIRPKRSNVKFVHDCEAIGEGSHPCLMLLRHRGYDPVNTDLFRAAYMIYEAKRFSESISSVGPKTRMTIHRPMWGLNHLAADDYNYLDLNDSAIQQLEAKRKQFFLQPVTDFRFDGEFIEPGDQPIPRPPIRDP